MDDPWTQLIEKGFDAFHITSFHNSGGGLKIQNKQVLFLFQIFGNKNIKQKQQMIPNKARLQRFCFPVFHDISDFSQEIISFLTKVLDRYF
jgi:hypothetical protein